LDKSKNVDFTNWSTYELKEDHRHRQPNQPPSDWTNVTFSMPYYANAIQFFPEHKEGNYFQREIVRYSVDKLRGEITISLIWNQPPWNLSIGWWFPN